MLSVGITFWGSLMTTSRASLCLSHSCGHHLRVRRYLSPSSDTAVFMPPPPPFFSCIMRATFVRTTIVSVYQPSTPTPAGSGLGESKLVL